MFYFILLFGVIALLQLLSVVVKPRRLAMRHAAAWAAHGSKPVAQPDDGTSALVARVLRGQRKEDRPCLTPIECVEQNRCAGHCGCR